MLVARYIVFSLIYFFTVFACVFLVTSFNTNANICAYRKLVIGINCPITDDIFDIVFINNKFQYLEVS